MAKINIVRIIKTEYGTYSLHFINPDGRRRRLSAGSDYQYAQRLQLKFTDLLIEGKDPEHDIEQVNQKRRTGSITIKDLFPVFMSRHGVHKSPKMQVSYKSSFKNICRCPQLADAEIRSVSKGIVLDYMHSRMNQDKVSAATVNREAAFLKVMLSCAVEWEMMDHNHLQGLKRLREAEKRDVTITMEQISALLEELPESLRNIVEFAIYTGFRKENILELKIASIHFHDVGLMGNVELILKGGRKEKFPLGPHAVEVLHRSIGNRQEGYVFLNPRTGTRYFSINKTFSKAVRKLNLSVNESTFRFHDLRHVFATWLHQAGVSLDMLRPLMGHRDRATTDRYATIDRLAIGNVLKMMPKIEHKKSSTNTHQFSDQDGKWQELASSN